MPGTKPRGGERREAPSDTCVRVRTLGRELRREFGCRVHKVPLHAGLSCPNREGISGRGGCIYCGPHGSAAPGADPRRTIAEQMRRGMDRARKRFGASRFIAYFQAFTNTYAPVHTLKELWDQVPVFEEAVGLAVGTRPDCVPDSVLDLFASYRERLPYLCLELGLQSAHDKTLQRIGRGHDFACFADAVSRARARGIPLCAHVILGLPGETEEEMMETVEVLLEMGIQGIKFHHLHVLRGSPLEREYRQGRVRLFEMEEYVDLLCRLVRRISGGMVIHRFLGEAPPSLLVAPEWTARKSQVLRSLHEALGEAAF